jgi:hypothetical protein
MTDLEQLIDQTVGQDTEHLRVTFLKYLSFGRQLNADPVVRATVREVLVHVFAILKEAGDQQALIEKVDEDEAFDKLAATPPETVGQALASFADLLSTVDAKHTMTARTRDEKLKALELLWA